MAPGGFGAPAPPFLATVQCRLSSPSPVVNFTVGACHPPDHFGLWSTLPLSVEKCVKACCWGHWQGVLSCAACDLCPCRRGRIECNPDRRGRWGPRIPV
eukprot:698648-Rhodomonas_salina.2